MPDNAPKPLLERVADFARTTAPGGGGPDAVDDAIRALVAADALEVDAEDIARRNLERGLRPILADIEQLRRDIDAGEAGSEEDIEARRTAIHEAASKALLALSNADRARLSSRKRPTPKPVTMFDAAALPRPAPLLSAPLGNSNSGQVLSIGEVALLSGEGGVGKSALATEIALAVAHPAGTGPRSTDGIDDAGPCRTVGGLLDVHGAPGPVIWCSYEEAPGEIGARGGALATAIQRDARAANAGDPADEASWRKARAGVHVIAMEGVPLYGPAERNGASGLYNSRPEKLAGWRILEAAAARIRPRLILIDPALAAFIGEANNPTAVREFVTALAVDLARPLDCGILITGHSNKESRGKSTKSDPFDAGHVGGTVAWTDAVRGALVFTHAAQGEGGPDGDLRMLAIPKANLGPRDILASAIPRRATAANRWIVGFQRDPMTPWRTRRLYEAAAEEPATAYPGRELKSDIM